MEFLDAIILVLIFSFKRLFHFLLHSLIKKLLWVPFASSMRKYPDISEVVDASAYLDLGL